MFEDLFMTIMPRLQYHFSGGLLLCEDAVLWIGDEADECKLVAIVRCGDLLMTGGYSSIRSREMCNDLWFFRSQNHSSSASGIQSMILSHCFDLSILFPLSQMKPNSIYESNVYHLSGMSAPKTSLIVSLNRDN